MMIYQKFFKNIDNATVLFFDEKKRYTAQDLKQKISDIHCALSEFSDQSYFAICTSDRFLFTASLFAIVYAGKVPIILGHHKEKLLNEQKSLFDVVLVNEPFNIDVASLNVTDIIENSFHADFDIFEQDISKQTVILMTSGSSSEPKKILKSIEYLAAETQLLMEKWANDMCGTTVLSTVSPSHQYGLTFNILLPLMTQAPIYNAQIFYQEELIKFQANTKYTFISSPAFLKRLDQQLKHDLTMNLIFSAGGALGAQATQDCEQTFHQWPIEIYGSSESGVIAFNQHNTITNNKFKAFSGVVIQQYEDETIKISSPLFAQDQDIRLNDRIEILSHGVFHILGRTDKIVKLEEKRISLTDIETRIRKILHIDHVYALVLSNVNRDMIGCVIVKEADDERALIRQVTEGLKGLIEPIAIPKRWRFVSEVPMNAQGKTSLFELRELFND